MKQGSNLVFETIRIRKPFFELRFEWKVIKGGNQLAHAVPRFAHPDGSFYTVFRVPRSESDLQGQVREWGQLAHFYATSGAAVGLFGRETPLLAGAPKGLSFSCSPKKKASRPPGQWNTSRVVWQGKAIRHWLNGDKVIDIELGPAKEMAPVMRPMMEELQTLSTRALNSGLQVQIENLDSPLLYRGIKLRVGRVKGKTGGNGPGCPG